MAKKKRVNLRLDSNEIAVVGTVDRWEHLISVYEAFANDPEFKDQREAWEGSASWIREWIEHAKSKEVDAEEEW